MSDDIWDNADDDLVSAPSPGVAAYWNGADEVTIRVARIRDGRVDEDLVSVPSQALRKLAQKLIEIADEQEI